MKVWIRRHSRQNALLFPYRTWQLYPEVAVLKNKKPQVYLRFVSGCVGSAVQWSNVAQKIR